MISANFGADTLTEAHIAVDTRSTNQDGFSFDGANANVNDGSYAFNSATYGAAVSNGNSPAATRDAWQILAVEFSSPQSMTRQVLGSLYPSFNIAAHNLGADVAEIIVYGGTLNDAERISVENYLSSKYNIDISATGNDHFDYESEFGAHVAGIGNQGGQLYTEAFSSHIFGVDTLAATTLDAGDFLYLGHDNRSTTWTTTDVPSMGLSNIQRIAREWRVDETNELGPVKFVVDTSALPGLPAEYDRYVLLVSTSSTFADAKVYEMSRVASQPNWRVALDPNGGDYLSIGIVKPVLGFENGIASDFETVGAPAISIKLNFIPSADISFSYATSDNGAAGGAFPFGAGTDYETIGSTPASILAGTDPPEVLFNLNINEDTDQESDEGVDITVSGAPADINVLNSPQTFTIRDDDNARKIYFDAANTTVNESAGTVTVQVNMTPSQVDPTNPTLVDYSVSGGTATDVDDFSILGGGTLTIPANNISGTFDVSLVDDAINEAVETIIVSLSNPTNSNLSLSQPTDFTINISDNDTQPSIQFNASSSANLESDTNPSIVLTLSALSGVDAQVDYTVSGSATGGGDDFTLVNGTATIFAGAISTTIDPIIVSDANPEEAETIVITLSSPTDALLGSETVHTYTIVNDDGAFGFSGPGGVGGSSVLPLWLKADSITGLADGASIASWDDVSGNGNDATQGTASEQAHWENGVSDQINGFPVVRFDGTNDHYDDTGYSYNVKAAFIIFKISSASQSASDLAHIWGSYNELVHIAPEPRGGGDQFGFSFDGNQSGFGTARYGLDGQAYGALVDDGNYYPWSYDQVYMVSVEYDDLETLTRQILGGLVDNFPVGTHHYGGDVAEIVVFDQELNDARRKIVENYLAAKYGIAILPAIDLYAYEGTHYYDVAGIGKDGNGDAHRAAESNNILRISDASSLGNNEYLLFGHDNAALSWSATSTPSDSIQRIAREWRLDETGNVGTVDVAIDTTYLAAKPVDHEGYVLLVDDNGDFTDGGTTVTSLSKSGKYYQASGIEVSGGQYVTVGTLGITAALTVSAATVGEGSTTYNIAVELSRASIANTDFTITVGGGSTATEGGGDDFTINPAVQILATNTSGNIEVTINNDSEVELDETVVVELTSATNGVTVGADYAFTLTIQDNDASSAGGTGPGGVRRAADFEAWWSADSAVFSDAGTTPATDGGVVQQWNDISGSTQDHPATIYSVVTDPAYNLSSNLVNGKPAIDFGAGDSPLTVLNESELNASDQSARTMAVAFRTGTDLSTRQVIYEEGGTGNGLNIWLESNVLHLSIWDATWDDNGGTQEFYDFTSPSPLANTVYVAFIEYDGDPVKTITAYLNTSLLGSTVIAGSDGDTWSGHAGDVGIGGRINDSKFGESTNVGGDGDLFSGKVMEALVLNGVLNDAESFILQNYLGAKYDANLTSGNGLFAHSTTHSYGVVGIGQQGAEFHVSATSDSLLTISNPSALASGEYLMIGHDNGSISSYGTSDIPNADFERLSREWRVTQTGVVGTVKITFDPSFVTGTPGADFSQYAILVDTDGDFTSGAAVHTLYQSGAIYEAEIQFADGDYFTLAAFRPSVQFVPAAVSAVESETSVSAIARLTYPVDGAVSVDYALNVSNSTAVRGTGPTDDFDFADGTLNIMSGDSTATVSITVNDDSDIESLEDFEIDLSNPSAGLFIGNDTTYVYSIEDDDQPFAVEFTVSTDTVTEDNGSYNVTIRLNQASGLDIDVDYAVVAGTADGSDFTLVDGTATILNGGYTANVLVSITDDGSYEDYETLVLQLSNPVNASVGSKDEFILVISDNDPLPEVSFASASLGGSEATSPGTFEVAVSETAGVPITVDYEVVTASSTASGSDYGLADGTLTIPAGSVSANILATVVNDLEQEVDETIQVRLFDNGNLVNATIGAQDVSTYTIQDNDAGGFVGPGGVGLPSDYVAWLRTDRLVEKDSLTSTAATNGSIVQRWIDYSGNDNNAKGGTGMEPTYLVNAVNGKPSIDFGGLDSTLRIEDTPDINTGGSSYDIRTIIAAFRAGSNVSNEQIVYKEGGGGNGYAIYIARDSVFATGWSDGNWPYDEVGMPITSGQIVVATLEFSVGDGERLTAYFNADSIGSRFNKSVSMPPHGGDIHIGGAPDGWEFGAGDYFEGEVMELMVSNNSLNTSQRTIVENYLGAKYGANLAPSGRRYYSYAISHGYGVVGIGRESSNDFHVKAKSDSLITVSNAADLGDGEWLFIGNDNGSVSSYVTDDVPGTGIERLGREWRVTETGDLGSVTITIDTAKLGLAPSAGFTEYVMMVDADGVFSANATLVPLTLDGSTWRASLDLSDGTYFTFGLVRPEIQFVSASSNGSESVTSPTIEVALNYPLSQDVTFNVAETGAGSATETSDFTFTDGVQTIAAGTTSFEVSPAIVDDSEVESDETVIFELTAPSIGVIGANATHTYNINDDDNFRKANLARADSTNTEDQSPIQIGVFLNARNSVSPTEIFYSVTGGTATNDSTDYYVQAVDTLVFAAGDTLEYIDINVVDDATDEQDETVIISLIGGRGATLGDTTIFTYTIADDDAGPTVQFTTATRSGVESAQTVDLAIELSAASGKDIVLPYTAVALSATENTDYQVTNSSVTILAGNTTDSIQFVVINDGITEANEQLRIDLGAPTNATLGANTSLTYSILDDDGLGFEGLGGVGNLDEQTAAWFRANAPGFGTSNGDLVTNWEDKTTNSNDGFQTTPSMQPQYLENIWNGRPVISFDGDDLIQLNDTDDINTGGPFDQKTIMVAFRTSIDVTTRQMLYEEGGGVRGLSIYIDNGSLYIGGWNNNNDDAGATTPWPNPGPPTNNTVFTTRPVAPNSNNFVFLQFDFLAGTGSIDGDVSASVNGEDLVTVDGAGRLFAHPGDIGIGGINEGTVVHDSNEGSVQNYNGNIGEVVVQNFVYNPAQFVIVNNYLSSKYNITLNSVPDVYAHDQNPTNFSYEILGIGQVNDSSHIDAKGSGIVRLSSPTQLDNNEFLLIGHDNGSVNAWQSAGVPNGDTDNFRILDRTWRVDETGDVGTVTMRLDASNLPAPPVGLTANYVMLVDDDGDFSSGATIYGLSSAAGYFQVPNVDLPDDSYITFGLANLVLGFTVATADGIEDISPATLSVSANYIASSTLTVDVAATPNSTAQVADYSLGASTVTISTGNQTGDLNINMVNDGDEEPLETIELALSNPSDGVLNEMDTVLFTIIDDDQARNIQFILTDSTGNEADSPALIRVFADSLSNTDSLKVYYEVTGGTATSTEDFVLAADTLRWPRYTDDPNDTIRTISLAIVPDLIDELDETVEITLFSPIQAGFGANRVFTYTITDDDSEPTIDWLTTANSGLESMPTGYAILQLSAASGQDITLNYSDQSTNPPTPGGIDYDLQGTSIIIPAGTTQDTISFSVFNDAITGEGTEDVVIRIEGATNATANVGSTFTYSIIDDDGGFGAEGPGGIGDEDEIAFWFRADVDVYSDLGTTPAANGNNVRQWNDHGGNLNNAVEVVVNDSIPSFEATVAGANNQSALSFDASNFEFLTIADDPLINTATQYLQKTIAVVFETGPNAIPSENQIIFEQGGGGNGFNIYHGTDGDLHFGAWSTNATPAWNYSEVTSAVGANQLVMAIFEIDADAGTLDAYVDGNAAVNGSLAGAVTNSFLNSHGGDPGIGGMSNDTRFASGTASGTGNFFDGRIFEIVEYNERVLTAPTRKILRNYFAAKYGITIGAEDVYAHDTGYDNEVFGMGIEDDEIHVTASGSGIVRVDNPQTITNGNYLLVGHDGSGVSSFTTTDTPPAFSNLFMERLDRTWRVDQTGEFGDVRVSVDTTLLPTFSSGFTDLFLVVGTSSDFSTYDTLIRFTETFGDELRTTYDFNDDEYFTIALAQNASGQIGAWNDPNTWLIGVPALDQPAFIQDSVYLTGNVTASRIIGLDNSPSDRGKLNLNGFTLTVTDSLLIQGFGGPSQDSTTFGAANGTVNYGGSGTDIYIQPLVYHNLTLSGTGQRHLSDKTVILNDFVIDDNPQVITNNNNLDVSGDWISAVNSVFTPGSGTVTFNGTGPQQISPTNRRITFNNLVINNTGGDVTLADTVEVAGTLTLTQNDLVLGNHRLLITNSAPAAIAGPGDNTSFIQADGTGVVEWSVAQGNTYLFPVGDGSGNYSPFSFEATAMVGADPTISINLTDNVQSQVDGAEAHISRYWTIEPTRITSVTFDITMFYTDADVSGNELDLVPIKFDVDADTSAFPTFTLDDLNNSLNWVGLTSFSDVTAGAEDDPLPVELIAFEALVDNESVVLTWATATEIDNDRFEVLWSGDGRSFETIAQVAGVGNSSSLQTYSYVDDEANVGTNYYRLRQVDFDGQYEYSPIVSASIEGKLPDFEVILYPNPTTSDNIHLRFKGLKEQTPVHLRLFDIFGRPVLDHLADTPPPTMHLQVQERLKAGMYYLMVTHDTDQAELKLIIR